MIFKKKLDKECKNKKSRKIIQNLDFKLKRRVKIQLVEHYLLNLLVVKLNILDCIQ